MTNIMNYLPELSEPERSYVQNLIDGMPTNLAEVFTIQYRRRRKDPQNVLLAAVIGLVACPGFQRFWLGETGMGCLFLFTGGLFLMGTIIDLATYKTLAFSHNQRVARKIDSELRNLETSYRMSSSEPFNSCSSRLNRQPSVYGDLIIQ